MTAPKPLPADHIQRELALKALAMDFRAGLAAADPKTSKTCDECPVISLCRIREAQL